jgi:hypothetical protein
MVGCNSIKCKSDNEKYILIILNYVRITEYYFEENRDKLKIYIMSPRTIKIKIKEVYLI